MQARYKECKYLDLAIAYHQIFLNIFMTQISKLSRQSSTNETFLSKILTICGQFLLRNCSFVVVRKISSMFYNFCHK